MLLPTPPTIPLNTHPPHSLRFAEALRFAPQIRVASSAFAPLRNTLRLRLYCAKAQYETLFSRAPLLKPRQNGFSFPLKTSNFKRRFDAATKPQIQTGFHTIPPLPLLASGDGVAPALFSKCRVRGSTPLDHHHDVPHPNRLNPHAKTQTTFQA